MCLLALPAIADVVKNPAISYTLERDSSVSMAIYNQDGAIVRQLLFAAPRKAGTNSEEWDGLDDKGRPATPGNYGWKLLATQGLHAEWITSLGTSLKPGYQIMPGNHVGVVAAAVDTAGDIYLMGGCNECVPGMAKVKRDGTRLWASDHLIEANNNGGCGVADSHLFSLLSTGHLISIDPTTGKGQWKINTGLGDPNSIWNGGAWLRLAARGETLVVASTKDGLIRWLRPADGSVIDEAKVPELKAVAIDGAGNVLAICGKSVVRLSRADHAPVTVVTDLTDPRYLAIDPQNGVITVYEAGDRQQIIRYTADGKLLATYGRKGGRLFGKYEPKDFRGVTGLSDDGKGGFIVIEANAAPRRAAIFNKDGKLEREWYGGLHYANGGAPDPADPSIVWYHSGSG